MTAELLDLAGVPVLICPPDGPALDEATALDLIADASYHLAEAVAVPAQRCSDAFFQLSSGVAGAVVQKFANYRLRLAIVGDISDQLSRSGALSAFVGEANRGNQTWFVADQAELVTRLSGQPNGQGQVR